jgi:hypothetical protein
VHGIYDYGSKFYASKSFLDNNPILSVPRQVLWAWIKYLSTAAAATTTTKHTSHYRTPTRTARTPPYVARRTAGADQIDLALSVAQ